MNPELLLLLAGILSAFALEWLVIPFLVRLGHRLRLFDSADSRKTHTGYVSRLGGLSFFPVILFALGITFALMQWLVPGSFSQHFFTTPHPYVHTQYFIFTACLVLMYLIGAWDDLGKTGYATKFAFQFFCGLLVVLSGIHVSELEGFLGLDTIPHAISLVISVILISVLINSFNLIDGMNGLASGLGILASATMTVLFHLRGIFIFAAISAVVLGCLSAFFYYNVFGIGNPNNRKHIFMGDTGSLVIGFALALLAMRYAVRGENPGRIPAESTLVVFSVFMVQAIDLVKVMAQRIIKGKNPFMPDRNHIHHALLEAGFSRGKTLAMILGLSSLIIVSNFMMVPHINIAWILLADIAVYAAALTAVNRMHAIRLKNGTVAITHDQ